MTPSKNRFFLFLVLLLTVWNLHAQTQKKTIKPSKADIESQFAEGLKSYLKEDYQEAILVWESLLNEKVNDPGLYYYLAKANAFLNSEANANMYAEKAHLLAPNSLDYGLFYADLLLKKRNYQDAIKVLHKISAYDETQPEVNIRLAQANLMLENGDEAIKALNKADHYIGDFPIIIRTKQFIYLKQKNWKKFQETSLHFLENFQEENFMEWELLEMLPVEEASVYEPLLDSVLVRYPDAQQINLIKSINRFKEGKYENAVQLLRQTFVDERVEPVILSSYLEDFQKTLLQKRDSFQLAPIVEEALVVYPEAAGLHSLLGDLAVQSNQLALAKSSLKKAVELGISKMETFAQLVQLYLYFQQPDSALVYAEKGIGKFPSNGFFYFQKGFVQSVRGNSPEAIATLMAGLPFADKRFEYYKDIYSLLGDLYHRIGNFLESDQAFEKVLAIDPKDDHVLNNYSYFLSLRKENLEKALKMSGQLVEDFPTNETYLDTHGWVWFQMANYEKALPFLLKAFQLSLDPSAEIIEHLGDVYFKLGNKKEAIKYWKMAFKKNSQRKLLEKKIEKKEYLEN